MGEDNPKKDETRGGAREEVPDAIRDKIKELLKEGNTSQEEIAGKFKITQPMVSKIAQDLKQDDEIESQFIAQGFDTKRAKRVLNNTPGISPKMTNYIVATLEESPNYQNPQGVFGLLISFGKLNAQAATITTNRIFGQVDNVTQTNVLFPEMFQTGQPTGTPVMGYPNQPQVGGATAGFSPHPPPQQQPAAPQLTEERITEIIAKTMEKEREKDELTKLREEIMELKSGAGKQESEYIEVKEPVLNPTDGTPIKGEKGEIIMRTKRVPVALASQAEQKDPIELLKDVLALKKEVMPEEPKGPQTDPAVLELLKHLVEQSKKPDTDPETAAKLEALRIELETEKVRRELGEKQSTLEKELATEKMKAELGQSPEEQITKTIVEEGISIAKDIKKDISETKDMARKAVLSAVQNPAQGAESGQWEKVKDLSEDELKTLEKGIDAVTPLGTPPAEASPQQVPPPDYDTMNWAEIKRLASDRGIQTVGKGRTKEVVLAELKNLDAKEAPPQESPAPSEAPASEESPQEEPAEETPPEEREAPESPESLAAGSPEGPERRGDGEESAAPTQQTPPPSPPGAGAETKRETKPAVAGET